MLFCKFQMPYSKEKLRSYGNVVSLDFRLLGIENALKLFGDRGATANCELFTSSVINKQTRCHFCVMLYFLLYKLFNMFRATMCPSSGADDWLVFSPRVGIELWLQEGCQNRLVVR